MVGISDSENPKLQSKLPPLVLHGNLETNDDETFTEEDNDGFLPTITSLNDNNLDVIFSRSHNGGLSTKKKGMDSSPNMDQPIGREKLSSHSLRESKDRSVITITPDDFIGLLRGWNMGLTTPPGEIAKQLHEKLGNSSTLMDSHFVKRTFLLREHCKSRKKTKR